MQTTVSGPASTGREAERIIRDAGYKMVACEMMDVLTFEPHEDFFAVDGGHSHIAGLIEHLGWRHRGVRGDPLPAIRIGGQG